MKDHNDNAMGQSIDVPESILNNLIECLVIYFEFLPDRYEFKFVSDYPYKSPRSVREFIGLIFHGVTDFQRKLGDQPRLHQYGNSYWTKLGTGGIVVQYLKHSEVSQTKSCLEMWFGPNFGGVSFCYSALEGSTRGSTVEKLNDDFIYSDVRTGKQFDFYEPFPMLRKR